LRRLTPQKHALFRQIVLEGALEQNGMAGFADLLSETDVNAIQAYIAAYSRAAIATVNTSATERPDIRTE